MAIQRQQNWLSGQRVDVAHLRSVESAITGDFDTLAGRVLAGSSPLVTEGFTLITTGITSAPSLQLVVANGTIIHVEASESGSVFRVPADRAAETLNATVSTRVSGAFTPNRTNYVGIDLRRTADVTTNDLVKFIDTTTLLETSRAVPLARTLDYIIVITTTDFGANPNIAPIAKVVTGNNNVITSVIDARNIAWRLGAGGSNPDPAHSFAWPAGRKEGSSGDVFAGGDKIIGSFKTWADAIMTRMWEQAGGEYWYSPTADRNVKLTRGTVFTSTGEAFEWTGTNLHWQGLTVVMDNSTATSNPITDQLTDVPGLTDLADGYCIYVDLVRSANTTLLAAKAPLATLGTPNIPGSRWVIAWRFGANIYTRDHGWAVGSSFKVATKLQVGTVRLSATDDGTGGTLAPRTVTSNSTTGYAIAAGLTRGNTGAGGSSDFFMGAGRIDIGGNSNDLSVNIGSFGNAQTTYIYGNQTFAGGNAPLTVYQDQNVSSMVGYQNRIAQFTARNDASGIIELTNVFDASGCIGFRIPIGSVDLDSAPSGANQIAAKLLFSNDSYFKPHPYIITKFNDTNGPSKLAVTRQTKADWISNTAKYSFSLTNNFFNDFTGDCNAGLVTVGTGGTATYDQTQYGGVLALAATSTGGSFATWQPSPDGVNVSGMVGPVTVNSWDVVFRAKLAQSLTTSTFIKIGLTRSGAGIFMQFGSTGLSIIGPGLSVLSSWTADTNWHVFRLAFNSVTGHTTMWVDAVQVADTTSLATGLNTGVFNLLAFVQNNISIAQTLYVDKAYCAYFPSP